jgi:uncharacterized membrane protein YhiD involved in acid resistance
MVREGNWAWQFRSNKLPSVIGFERQWRNRLAGLRTNTLVALGAATFVIFSALVPGDGTPLHWPI